MPISGPYCAYCNNATADWQANPDTFDIHEHIKRCFARFADIDKESSDEGNT